MFSGNSFDDESTLTDVAKKKKRIRRTKKEMVEIKRLKKLKGKFQKNPKQYYVISVWSSVQPNLTNSHIFGLWPHYVPPSGMGRFWS